MFIGLQVGLFGQSNVWQPSLGCQNLLTVCLFLWAGSWQGLWKKQRQPVGNLQQCNTAILRWKRMSAASSYLSLAVYHGNFTQPSWRWFQSFKDYMRMGQAVTNNMLNVATTRSAATPCSTPCIGVADFCCCWLRLKAVQLLHAETSWAEAELSAASVSYFWLCLLKGCLVDLQWGPCPSLQLVKIGLFVISHTHPWHGKAYLCKLSVDRKVRQGSYGLCTDIGQRSARCM